MTEHDLTEAHAVRQKTHEWIATMETAGISEAVIVTAAMQALIERALVSGGPHKTAKWLRSQARQTEKHGQELIDALRGGD